MRAASRQRSRTAVLGFLAGLCYVLVLLVALAWNSILLGVMQDVHLNDLGKFYYDARAFLLGAPMYEPSPATLVPITETTSKQLLNLNPPHFHLVLLPVAWLEPQAVLVLWLLTGILALTLSLYATFRELGFMPSAQTLLPAGLFLVSSAAFGSILITGQLTLHLLPFVTWAWIAARRQRWKQVGAAIGIVISIKSFMLVFLPWLAIRGRATTVAASLAVAGAAFLSGVAVFGTQSWWGWLSAMASIDWYGLPLDASLRSFVVRLFDHTPHYEAVMNAPGVVTPLWRTGFVLIGCTSLGMAILDRTPEATDRSFTLLILAAILMSPLGWIYYVLFALPPAIGLLSATQNGHRHDRLGRILRWGRGSAVAVGGCALLVPTVVVVVTGTSRLHTLTIGSAHFWALWCLWCAVVCDGLLARGPLGSRVEEGVRSLTPTSAL